MITYKLTNCVECTTIPALLADIDCKLVELAKSQYNNVVFMLNQRFPSRVMKDLLNYKRILECKTCNADYANCYSIEEISGRVKLLIYK